MHKFRLMICAEVSKFGLIEYIILMNKYDDYAVSPEFFEIMAKEFKKQQDGSIFSINKNLNQHNFNLMQDNFKNDVKENQSNICTDKIQNDNLNISINKDNIYINQINIQSIEQQKTVLNKVEYLSALVKDLKTRASNNDVLIVLNQLQTDIENQQILLFELFEVASAQKVLKADINMFCNNLKIAINTTSEIVKLLIKIKDSDETSYEQKEALTQSIDAFLDINNNLVSLFGECRYLKFGINNKQ